MRYQKALKQTFDTSNKTDLAQYNLEPISRAIQEVPLALAICVGGMFVFQGSITMGILIAYISAIKKLIDPLSNSYQLIVRSQMAMVSVSRVFDIIEIQPEEEFTDDTKLSNEASTLSFKNVSFGYNKDNVLSDICFEVKSGEKIAFVGESGSGKSTILKLISRQISTDDGKILYKEKEYNDISPGEIRRKIGSISQETTLFPMSIADNIRIGNPTATKEQISHALKLAGCESFVNELPKGMDTVLSEKGNNLSGGQRQRLSIARAIAKDASILLLDEPTSALDTETEKHICKTIEEISKDRTVITVAHRLTTIQNYNAIYVISDGKILEHGTHSELMSNKGRYYKMYLEFTNKEMGKEA